MQPMDGFHVAAFWTLWIDLPVLHYESENVQGLSGKMTLALVFDHLLPTNHILLVRVHSSITPIKTVVLSLLLQTTS